MWIRIDCPNGHPVKVEEKYAGRMGRCPACGAKVPIPQPEKRDLSEDAILDILGPGAPPPPGPLNNAEPAAPQVAVQTAPVSAAPVNTAAAPAAPKPSVSAPAARESVLDDAVPTKTTTGSVIMGSSKIMGGATVEQPTRLCPACKRKVSIRYQICPHCRTYMPISDLVQSGGAGARSATMSCPHCGVTSFPGASVCGNCGESLR